VERDESGKEGLLMRKKSLYCTHMSNMPSGVQIKMFVISDSDGQRYIICDDCNNDYVIGKEESFPKNGIELTNIDPSERQ
jgi:hypothetical protein